MSKERNLISEISCNLCGNKMKVGFYCDFKNGCAIKENHPFYELRIIKKDLAKEYFEGYRDCNAGIEFIESKPICPDCFEKIACCNIIEENKLLKKKNEELKERIKFYIAND